ncbi:MAG: sigma-70 family RNA polymerase sigma factor, partial [Oscillospiraceae bacterium]|nr:sigma-70 family RNA polymerase sigma factor [Oscillospiraceae bacterium]
VHNSGDFIGGIGLGGQRIGDIFDSKVGFGIVDGTHTFNLKGFIGVIAKRKAIDMYRRLSVKADRTISTDDEGFIEISSGENIIESSETSERNSILLNKIKELGEPDTTIIIKQYYYNMTVAEIGKAISMTAAAVQKRSVRARQKLKTLLCEVGINY